MQRQIFISRNWVHVKAIFSTKLLSAFSIQVNDLIPIDFLTILEANLFLTNETVKQNISIWFLQVIAKNNKLE